MKKLFEIIRQKNLLVPVVFLIVAAFVGCASPKIAITNSNPTPIKTSDVVVARTPEIEFESSRIEPLENHDSGKPEIYNSADEFDLKTVTKANFDRIKIGMSYAEAVKIFGDKGVQTSTMKVHDRETTIFKWTVPDFSRYIDLEFENGKVIEKKQKGLM